MTKRFDKLYAVTVWIKLPIYLVTVTIIFMYIKFFIADYITLIFQHKMYKDFEELDLDVGAIKK
jgi:hypothetical protein